jgi:hypothetical protein
MMDDIEECRQQIINLKEEEIILRGVVTCKVRVLVLPSSLRLLQIRSEVEILQRRIQYSQNDNRSSR